MAKRNPYPRGSFIFFDNETVPRQVLHAQRVVHPLAGPQDQFIYVVDGISEVVDQSHLHAANNDKK